MKVLWKAGEIVLRGICAAVIGALMGSMASIEYLRRGREVKALQVYVSGLGSDNVLLRTRVNGEVSIDTDEIRKARAVQ